MDLTIITEALNSFLFFLDELVQYLAYYLLVAIFNLFEALWILSHLLFGGVLYLLKFVFLRETFVEGMRSLDQKGIIIHEVIIFIYWYPAYLFLRGLSVRYGMYISYLYVLAIVLMAAFTVGNLLLGSEVCLLHSLWNTVVFPLFLRCSIFFIEDREILEQEEDAATLSSKLSLGPLHEDVLKAEATVLSRSFL